MSRTITVTSGKGGVGKTNISLNLALQLSKMGYKTCLFDADLGLANINILLGLQPENDLKDVIFGGRDLKDVIIRGHEGVDILPGSSGVEEMANLSSEQMEPVIRAFSEMDEYDFLLVDTSAGISKNVVSFCLASPELLLVITPEPTSLTDAFSLLKVLTLNGFRGDAKVVLNQCRTSDVAKQVYGKFKSAVAKYLEMDIQALGVVYEDDKVTEAVKQQRPLLSLYPEARASKCIQKIGERLVSMDGSHLESLDMESFWRRCFRAITSPLKLPQKDQEGKKEGVTLAPSSHETVAQPRAGEAEVKGAEKSFNENLMPGSGETSVADRAEQGRKGLTLKRNSSEGAEEDGYSYHALISLMERLVEGVSSVSREIRLVRAAVEGNGKSAQRGALSNEKDSNTEVIPLDLESFLRNRDPDRKEP